MPGHHWCLRCVVLSALGPSYTTTTTINLQPTESTKPIICYRLPETNAGGLPFRVEFPYGCACNSAGGQQSGRSSRASRVSTRPGPPQPTCSMIQHLLARASTHHI